MDATSSITPFQSHTHTTLGGIDHGLCSKWRGQPIRGIDRHVASSCQLAQATWKEDTYVLLNRHQLLACPRVMSFTLPIPAQLAIDLRSHEHETDAGSGSG